MRRLLNHGRAMLVSASVGGSILVLSGCDPAVRDTVLTGVGTAATGLASTFIQAFIESLQQQGDETATTVRADVQMPIPDPIFM